MPPNPKNLIGFLPRLIPNKFQIVLKNIITHSKNGYLVNNENDWIKFLIKLIDDSNLRSRIGREAINTIDNDYTVDVLSQKYLNVLNNI